jgi:hypothetical protein
VGNISKGKSPVRPQVREEIVEDLRSLQKCLSKLSAQCTVWCTAGHLPENCKTEITHETL